MVDILNIGLTGLLAHQQSLSVTGHNIANASTEGYSRQTAILDTQTPEFSGGFYFGSGTSLTGVQRNVNEFYNTQLLNDISAFNYSETLRSQLDQLDLTFSDTSTGLTESQNRFFSALQGANDDPTSMTARQAFLGEAQSLVSKFESLSGDLADKANSLNQLITSTTSEITNIASEIATLNGAIISSSGSGSLAEQPNDLLDQRDRLLNSLSELVDIRTSTQTDGAVNVFIGTGQALVISAESMNLVAQPSSFNPEVSELAIQSSSSLTTLGDTVSGGVLGGLLSVRDGTLADAVNSLGRIAIAIAGTINEQHQLGMDLEGNLGGDFFTDINSASAIASRTSASSNNAVPQDQIAEVRISDIGALTTSDYRLTFTSPTTYVVTRLSDNKVNTAIDPAVTGTIAGIPATLQFDGLDLTLDRPSGNFATGDSFLIRPTASGATEIGLVVQRPEEIALASPIRTSSDLSNQGTGTIDASVVTDTSGALFTTTPGQLSPPLIISFTSATTYDILDNSGPTPVPLVPPQAGLTFPPTPANALLPASFGIDLAIQGQPQAGDIFTVDFNTNGFQDSRNGLAMGEAQTAQLLDNGLTSIPGAYGLLLQDVGVAASQARLNAQAGETLLQQSQAQRDSVSAVNLDEEAAKLIELEQAYGASAQVINVAISLFDTLLSAVRT